MSPTVNRYQNNILLSNLDENKNKFFETPQKYSNFYNDMNWNDTNIFQKDNMSPLLPRNPSKIYYILAYFIFIFCLFFLKYCLIFAYFFIYFI